MSIFDVFSLCGGLGLFLYGMKLMSEGLEQVAGDRMRRLLEVLTNNRLMAVGVGVLVTAIIQSSSATTVMVVGFVNAGLMNLMQAVGVIMGANIGTTITAQLVAFKLTKIAPVFLLAGVLIILFSKKKTAQRVGQIIAGFGILFVGMEFMGASMEPLQNSEAFRSFMVNFQNPFMGILAGTLVTAVIQSSSASVGILQALAMQGLIGIDSAIFVILGQNIGTCITAIISCIGTNNTAKRAAIIHLLFNLVGTIIFLLILTFVPFTDWIASMSPGDTVRQIANAHTIFNIVVTVLLFPCANLLVWLSKKIIPGEDPQTEQLRLKYLDERILETPAIALAQVYKETERMGRIAKENVNVAMEAFFTKNEALFDDVEKREKVLNYLNHEITSYLVKFNTLHAGTPEGEVIGALYHVVSDMERVGDHAENIVEYAESRAQGVSISDAAIVELKEMAELVDRILEEALLIFHTRSKESTNVINPIEERIDEMKDSLRNRHIERLNRGECTPRSGMIFLDLVTNLERIADHATNIAYSVREM